MKKSLQMRVYRRFAKCLSAGILFFYVSVFTSLMAQVNFTQTTDADFNKGVLNNVLVGGNNVYLQYAASDVGTWLTTTVLPQTLSGHRAAVWNNQYVYIVGGWNDVTYSSAVYRATIQAGGISGWSTLNSLPVALKDAAVVIGTNTIYVIGGRDGSQAYNTIYYATINTDASIGTWQTSSVPLPVARWGHTAVYLNGYIYVAGGAAVLTETSALNTVYYTKVLADNTLASFTTGTALPATRNRHTMVTYNSMLYVLGGFATGGTKVSTVYYCTPGVNGANGAWSTGTALPVTISNHSSVVINGLIMVLAGETGGTLSNTVYYANIDQALPWTWITSPNLLYDQTKDGAAFAGNGIVNYTGGTNLSGTPIFNTRYSNLTLSTNYINHGVFTSNPFYELGAERLINTLTFTASYSAPANCEVAYRVAGADKIWGDWTALTTVSPITVNQTKQYLQYKVILTGSGTSGCSFNDMMLTTPGTQLTGNLNAITTFTQALSPYWATGDISFTSGTHTFQAGTTVLFLPGTGLTVSQANVVCSGTAVDSVKFMYFTSEIGQWDGIYFDPNSDVGVSSQFTYTVIANAGYGSNNANLYCNQTNEPLLTRCSIRYADGNGIRLGSAHINLNNCVIKGNTENGAYLETSNPTFVSTTLSYNTGAGVFLTSPVSEPTYSTSTISYNGYGMRYPSPNFTILPPNGSPTMTNNTHNGIAIDGGDISGSNKVWNSISYPYILLGTVRLAQYAGATRLTIEPGNTVKAITGVQIQIGVSNSYGGELYAIGTVDSLITFTSHNGVAGGWNGIYFTDFSDNWGGVSVMDYCVIEKGNDYNLFSESTVQPTINHSKIQNAVLDGARNSAATHTIQNTQFLNNGRYPYYWLNPDANPVHTGNTYSGNVINRIAMAAGTYPWNRTLNNDNVPYLALNDIVMGQYAGHSKLTLDPGVILEFEAGKKLQLGYPNSYGGDLFAEGTAISPIIFKPFNGVAGGWEGIYFNDFNDNWGGTSSLKYCTIEKGNLYNIKCETSGQPSMENCIIQNSLHDGLIEYNSNPLVKNCQFLNNAGYPINYTDWRCNSLLTGNTYTGNNPNYIALSGGTYDANRTFYNDGVPYRVLDNITVALYASHARITVRPGVTIAFEPGKKLQLGYPNSYGGDLWAEGNADSIIIFKPYNNLAGGWDGIYFTDFNDNWGGTSSLKYCNIEKAANYNILAEGSGQPYMEHCILTQSTGNGMRLTNSTITIRNCSFTYNGSYGIQLEGSSAPTIGNDALYTNNLYNNTTFEIYNNTANNINARYNYWGTGDSAMIASRIYDKYDNTAKGIVYFGHFAQVPSIPSPTMILGGTVVYANVGSNPMKNATMVLKTFGGATVATTNTNTSGVYAFPSVPSGNYQMTITPSNAWGGVNSTDALLILNHFAHLTTLTGVALAASDVNVSQTVNATDVLFVMRRYTGLITSFPSGDYLYNTTNLVVNGNQVTNDFQMLCFGDANASYAPTVTDESPVILNYDGTLVVNSFSNFDLPVTIHNSLEAGAISLGFYYPSEYLEITGAEVINGSTNVVTNSENGLFRMAWCDLVPVNTTQGETVIVLHFTTKDLTGLNGSISLELFGDSEFSDANAIAFEGVILSIPEIQTLAVGIDQASTDVRLTACPNPMMDKTIIRFNLAESSSVTISLCDLRGIAVERLTDEYLEPGFHEFELSAQKLDSGIYICKIDVKNNHQEFSKMMKVVVSK
jgi:hypothetical protein